MRALSSVASSSRLVQRRANARRTRGPFLEAGIAAGLLRPSPQCVQRDAELLPDIGRCGPFRGLFRASMVVHHPQCPRRCMSWPCSNPPRSTRSERDPGRFSCNIQISCSPQLETSQRHTTPSAPRPPQDRFSSTARSNFWQRSRYVKPCAEETCIPRT